MPLSVSPGHLGFSENCTLLVPSPRIVPAVPRTQNEVSVRVTHDGNA